MKEKIIKPKYKFGQTVYMSRIYNNGKEIVLNFWEGVITGIHIYPTKISYQIYNKLDFVFNDENEIYSSFEEAYEETTNNLTNSKDNGIS